MNLQHDPRDELLLVRLAAWLELACDRPTAVRHLDSSRREDPGATDAGAAAFALACRRAGMRVATFRASVDVAVERATRETPLVARVDGDVGGAWAVLLDRRGANVLTLLDPQEQPRWISRNELARHLGLHDRGDSVEWLMVHAATPCAPAEAAVDSGKDTPAPLARLAGILRPDRSDLWAVLVFAVAMGALLLATPIAVQALVNFVAFGGAVAPVLFLAIMLAVGLAFAALIGALQAWIVEILQRRIFVRMVADLAHRLPRVHWLNHERTYGPELVNRFFDVITVQKMSSLLLLDGVGVLLGVLIGLVVLAFYHPILLAFDLLMVLSISGIVFLLGRNGIRTAIRESKTKYAVASWLEDIARNPLTFKPPAAREFVLHRSDELTREYVGARRAHYRVLFRQILGMLGLQVAANVSLLAIGGVLVIRGELTLGQLVAAELIVTYVVGSIAKMGKHFESFYDLMAAVDKLGLLLDQRLERSTGDAWTRDPAIRDRGAEVRFNDVTIASPSGQVLLDQLSFDISRGERVGITGPSGCGKSSLVELLYGLLDPVSGRVEIDGLDVRSIRLETLREQVALVGEPEIFEGTIRDNILMGRSLSTEAVHDTLRKTGLLDACGSLPDGIGTRLTSKGVPLSDVQVDRLMLARVMAGAPRLLLVDALLERMSPASLQQQLDVLMDRDAPWSLVMVSNRDDVLRRCDRVIDLSRAAEGKTGAAS